MTRRAACLLICSVFAAACGDDSGKADAGVGTPPPPISAETSTTSGAPSTSTDAPSTSTGMVAGCGCADGMFCAAAHVGGVSDPEDPALQFTCQDSCVPEADPSQWCSPDFPSCCDGLPCTEDGFCGGNGLGTGAAATSTTGDVTSSSGDATTTSSGDGGTSGSTGTTGSTGGSSSSGGSGSSGSTG